MADELTTVTFEVATLADTIARASTIAPTPRGNGDSFSGVYVEVDSDNQSIEVRATDGVTFFTEWIDFVKCEGPNTAWRLPSKVVSRYLNSIPLSSNPEITLEGTKSELKFATGRTVLRLTALDHREYPTWLAYDEGDMHAVPELGLKLKMVEWACSDNMPQLGIHLDGKKVYCTDTNKLVVVDLEIPDFDTPITIPPKSLSPLLKNIGDTRIRIENGKLFVMPDDHSQIRAPVIDMPFPDPSRPMSAKFDYRLDVKKQVLMDSINRVMGVKHVTKELLPQVELYIGLAEIGIMAVEQETGRCGDVIDVPGFADHDRVRIIVAANELLDVLSHAPNDLVEIGYNTDDSARKVLYINGRSSYEAWLPQILGAKPV